MTEIFHIPFLQNDLQQTNDVSDAIKIDCVHSMA